MDELRSRLVHHAEDIGREVWGEPNVRNRREWRWGRGNGSLALCLEGPRRGLWNDRNGSGGGDLLAALRLACGGNWNRAVERACAITGYELESWALTPEQRQRRAAQMEADRERLAAERATRRAKAEAEAKARDEAEIEKARILWAARVSLRGTSGYAYLVRTRHIPEPDSGFGDDIAWHPAQRAAMLAARSPSGRVTAVQLIRVTPDGRKRVRSGALVKKTVGRLLTDEGQSALRLPGRADANPAVLVHAEGGETGLSVWAATGLTTWIGIGPLFDVQHDVHNVVCIDDDAPDSDRAKVVRKHAAEWTGAGIRFALATPWAKPRADKSDFNDVLKEGGVDAVRKRIARFLPHPGPQGSNLPAYYPAPETTLQTALDKQEREGTEHWTLATRVSAARRDLNRRRAEAFAQAGGEDELTPAVKVRITKKLHRAVAAEHGFGERIPVPPMALFSGAQGSGKTRLFRHLVLADRSSDVVWFTEPTTDKAEEEFAAYQASGLAHRKPAKLIRGRSRPDPERPGHLMCDRSGTAEAVAEAGLSVIQNLCRECPLSAACGDQRQRREARELAEGDRGAVFFAPSEYWFLPAPMPMPDHAIVDESLIIAAIKVTGFKLADIRNVYVSNWSGTPIDLNALLRTICDAVETPWSRKPAEVERVLAYGLQPTIEPMPLGYLRKAGVTLDALKELASAIGSEIEALLPDVNGGMSDQAIMAAIEGAKVGTLRHAHALVSAIIREYERPRDTMNALTYSAADGTVRISSLRQIYGLKHASLTALDGTGDVGLARKLFGQRLAHYETRFPRQAEIISSVGKLYSRQSIIGRTTTEKAIRSREADAGRLRGDIATMLGRLPSGSMAAGSKRVIEVLANTGAIPAGILTATFGALRGINRWEASPAGLFIGSETISLRELETLARAYMADDDAPFISMDHPADEGWPNKQWPYKATRMRRMRDGTLEPVEVEVHPDPRCQAVLEQIREAELIQAIDRLRAIWNQRQIVLLNDLALDIEYDRIYPHRHLVAGGNPLELAYQETGILPHSPCDLHRLCPDRFRTVKAAEHALADYPLNPNKGSIWKRGVFVSYRRQGQQNGGKPARVLIDPARHPDAKAALQAALGPLKSINGEPCEQPPAAPTPPAKVVERVRPIVRKLPPVIAPEPPPWVPQPWELPPWVLPPVPRAPARLQR